MCNMQTQRPTPSTTPRKPLLLVALLSLLAAGLLVELGRSGAMAQYPEPAHADDGLDSPDSVMAIPAQLGRGEEGIVLIDTQRRTMALYRWESDKRRLRWLASRNFKFDLQIEDYNTEMKPAEVRKLAQQANRLSDEAP
jgi:hypothetical protein